MSARSNLALAFESESTHEEPGAEPAIHFEDGLYGFPECRSFRLLPTAHDGLYWLQSTEHEALGLLLADPFRFFRGYAVDLPPLDVARLDASGPADLAILAIVTLADGPGRASTANLQGPIVFNLGARKGRQVIVNRPGFGVRELIELPAR